MNIALYLLIVLDPFGECLNLDVIYSLIFYIVIDLSFVLCLHVFDP
jgi:hypothetical protein